MKVKKCQLLYPHQIQYFYLMILKLKNKIFAVKKVGSGTLDELFEKGPDLVILIKLARLFESVR